MRCFDSHRVCALCCVDQLAAEEARIKALQEEEERRIKEEEEKEEAERRAVEEEKERKRKAKQVRYFPAFGILLSLMESSVCVVWAGQGGRAKGRGHVHDQGGEGEGAHQTGTPTTRLKRPFSDIDGCVCGCLCVFYCEGR